MCVCRSGLSFYLFVTLLISFLCFYLFFRLCASSCSGVRACVLWLSVTSAGTAVRTTCVPLRHAGDVAGHADLLDWCELFEAVWYLMICDVWWRPRQPPLWCYGGAADSP